MMSASAITPSLARRMLEATAYGGRWRYKIAAAAFTVVGYPCTEEDLHALVPERRGRPALDDARLIADAKVILDALDEAGSVKGAHRLLVERGMSISKTTVQNRIKALRAVEPEPEAKPDRRPVEAKRGRRPAPKR